MGNEKAPEPCGLGAFLFKPCHEGQGLSAITQVGLELVDQANDGFNRGRLDLVGVSSFFVFILRVGEGGVHAGTLAEGVAVANSAGEALQRSIGVIDGVSIEVAGVGRSGTAHDRNANTEAKTPALGTQGAELITIANHSLLGRIINGHVVGRYRFGIVEILAAEVNLQLWRGFQLIG